MKNLSIFIDESGDFGTFEPHSPYYLFSLVLHEQEKPIDQELLTLESRLAYSLVDPSHCFHTMPMIRREADYSGMDLLTRRKLFGMLFSCFRKLPVQYTTIYTEKTQDMSSMSLQASLSRQLSMFIQAHYDYFASFDKVVVYYDSGQAELARIIVILFSAILANFEYRLVQPSQYRLFQVADLCCTMDLIKIKLEKNILSRSEEAFFESHNNLKKQFIKVMEKKSISHKQ